MSPSGKTAPELKVYVAFQGGGARGIAHISALRALESGLVDIDDALNQRTRPAIHGLAGTSAGSIIAALVACGYTADDLLHRDKNSQQHLLKKIKSGKLKSLSDLFTASGWKRIKRALLLASILRSVRRGPYIISFAAAAASIFFILPIAWLIWLNDIEGLSQFIVNFTALSLPIIAVVALFVGKLVISHLKPGLAPLDEVKSVLNEAMRAGPMPGLPSDRDITFRDLEAAKGLPIYIIATNLTTRSIQVFSARTTPDICIADAVCASISLPYIFKPYEINISGIPQKFADGGALSNLPLWTFDEERARDPACWTIGFSLKSESDTNISSNWLSALVDAVVAGPLEIHARGIPNLMLIHLRTTLRLLHFDKTLLDFKEEVARIEEKCTEDLFSEIDTWRVNEFLRNAVNKLLQALNNELAITKKVTRSDLKIALLCAPDRNGKRKIKFQHGYTSHERNYRDFAGLTGKSGAYQLQPRANSSHSNQSWGLRSSAWAIALPLDYGRALDGGPAVLIESSDLTESDICDITGEQAVKAAMQAHLLNVLDSWNKVNVRSVFSSYIDKELT